MDTKIRVVLREKGTKVISVTPDHTVLEAVEVMNLNRIGSVVVLEDGELIGIFTERDVLVRVIGARRDAIYLKVGEVMTTEMVVVSPNDSVQDTLKLMTEKRCRHLPVIEYGRLRGLISTGDLNHWVTRHLETEVRDLEHYISGGY